MMWIVLIFILYGFFTNAEHTHINQNVTFTNAVREEEWIVPLGVHRISFQIEGAVNGFAASGSLMVSPQDKIYLTIGSEKALCGGGASILAHHNPDNIQFLSAGGSEFESGSTFTLAKARAGQGMNYQCGSKSYYSAFVTETKTEIPQGHASITISWLETCSSRNNSTALSSLPEVSSDFSALEVELLNSSAIYDYDDVHVLILELELPIQYYDVTFDYLYSCQSAPLLHTTPGDCATLYHIEIDYDEYCSFELNANDNGDFLVYTGILRLNASYSINNHISVEIPFAVELQKTVEVQSNVFVQRNALCVDDSECFNHGCCEAGFCNCECNSTTITEEQGSGFAGSYCEVDVQAPTCATCPGEISSEGYYEIILQSPYGTCMHYLGPDIVFQDNYDDYVNTIQTHGATLSETCFTLGRNEIIKYQAIDSSGHIGYASIVVIVNNTYIPFVDCYRCQEHYPDEVLLCSSENEPLLVGTEVFQSISTWYFEHGYRFPSYENRLSCSCLPTLTIPRVTTSRWNSWGPIFAFSPSTAHLRRSEDIIELGSGTFEVVYTADDDDAHVGSCILQVELIAPPSSDEEEDCDAYDYTPPVLTCPDHVIIEANSLYTYVVSAVDDCTATEDLVVILSSSEEASLDEASLELLLSVGIHGFSHHVMDMAGNIGTCYWEVEVRDTIRPTITCPDDFEIRIPHAEWESMPLWFDIVAMDDIDLAPLITYVSEYKTGSWFPSGVYEIEVQASDSTLNTDQCTFTVTVLPSYPTPLLAGVLTKTIVREIAVEEFGAMLEFHTFISEYNRMNTSDLGVQEIWADCPLEEHSLCQQFWSVFVHFDGCQIDEQEYTFHLSSICHPEDCLFAPSYFDVTITLSASNYCWQDLAPVEVSAMIHTIDTRIYDDFLSSYDAGFQPYIGNDEFPSTDIFYNAYPIGLVIEVRSPQVYTANVHLLSLEKCFYTDSTFDNLVSKTSIDLFDRYHERASMMSLIYTEQDVPDGANYYVEYIANIEIKYSIYTTRRRFFLLQQEEEVQEDEEEENTFKQSTGAAVILSQPLTIVDMHDAVLILKVANVTSSECTMVDVDELINVLSVFLRIAPTRLRIHVFAGDLDSCWSKITIFHVQQCRDYLSVQELLLLLQEAVLMQVTDDEMDGHLLDMKRYFDDDIVNIVHYPVNVQDDGDELLLLQQQQQQDDENDDYTPSMNAIAFVASTIMTLAVLGSGMFIHLLCTTKKQHTVEEEEDNMTPQAAPVLKLRRRPPPTGPNPYATGKLPNSNLVYDIRNPPASVSMMVRQRHDAEIEEIRKTQLISNRTLEGKAAKSDDLLLPQYSNLVNRRRIEMKSGADLSQFSNLVGRRRIRIIREEEEEETEPMLSVQLEGRSILSSLNDENDD